MGFASLYPSYSVIPVTACPLPIFHSPAHHAPRRGRMRRSRRHERDRRPKIIRAEPPRRLRAAIPPAGLPDLRQRSLALETRPSRDRRRRRVVRRDGLDLPWPAHALARAKVSKILQARLRAAVLQRQPVVRRKDREVARPAHDVASTGNERAVAVAAGGGRDEHGVGPTSCHSEASEARTTMCNRTSENP